MDTARYKAFLTAVETGSLSKAAEILNYTPSGVSQLISALEQELSLSLLKRNRRGVSLTPSGELLLPVIRELLYQENRLFQIVSDLNHMITGDITIATFSSIASSWLPRVIKTFNEQYPAIKIHLLEADSQQADVWLNDRTADLAFYCRHDDMKAEWFPLQTIAMNAIVHPSHPLAGSDSFPFERLKEENLIVASLGTASDLDVLMQEILPETTISFTTLEGYSTLAMVEQGLGVAIMNELMTRRFDANVIQLPFDPPKTVDFGIGVLSYANSAPAVRKFIDCAVDTLNEEHLK